MSGSQIAARIAFPQNPTNFGSTKCGAVLCISSLGPSMRIPTLLCYTTLAVAGLPNPTVRSPWIISAWGMAANIQWWKGHVSPFVPENTNGSYDAQFIAQFPKFYAGLGLSSGEGAPQNPGSVTFFDYAFGDVVEGQAVTQVVDKQLLLDPETQDVPVMTGGGTFGGIIPLPPAPQLNPNIDFTPNFSVYSVLQQPFVFSDDNQLFPFISVPSFIIAGDTQGTTGLCGWVIWNATFTLYYTLGQGDF